MKKTISLMLLLAGLSAVSGYLMSKASWIGRVGITLFYKEYNLLKIWWQGGSAVFIFLLLLFLLHTIIHSRVQFFVGKLLHLVLLAAAAGALYLSYDDFSHDLSHKLLGWRFHYGIYLIWVEWILLCLFFLVKGRKKITTEKEATVKTAPEQPAINTDKKELRGM